MLTLTGCAANGEILLPKGKASEKSSIESAPPPETGATKPPVLVKKHIEGAARRVAIPRLNVDSKVVSVKAPNRTLIPPGDPNVFGWWADGAKPGAKEGSALIAGHAMSSGYAPLNRLETLKPGDTIIVGTTKGRITYQVKSVEIFSKGAIAEKAEQLFSQDSKGRLVLMTCEDWDGVRYNSNVVVTALPV